MSEGESFVGVFQALDPDSQRLVSELARRLLSTQNPVAAECLPLNALVDPWIDYLANCERSPLTLCQYRRAVGSFLREFPTPGTVHVDTYFTLLRGKSSPYVRHVHSAAIRNFLRFCKERGCPVQELIDCIPPVKVPQKRRTAPPPEDVEALLSYKKLKPRTRALLYIFVDSGPRLAEVLNLRLTDVDLKHLTITVMGKGAKQRTIPISRDTARAIKAYLAEAPRSTYLFPGARSLTWHRTSVEQHLRVLCLKVGIQPFTPHQLRHYFATRSINDGANIRSISEILGHRDPGITLKLYVHSNPEFNREEHRKHTPLTKLHRRKGQK